MYSIAWQCDNATGACTLAFGQDGYTFLICLVYIIGVVLGLIIQRLVMG